MSVKLWDSLLSLLRQLEIGWSTGWWFTAAFGLVNIVLIIKYGRAFTKRLVAFPKFQSLHERIISMASVFLFARAIMVYTVFVPIKGGGASFYGGITVFVLGLIVYTYAVINFATTPPDKPVDKRGQPLTCDINVTCQGLTPFTVCAIIKTLSRLPL